MSLTSVTEFMKKFGLKDQTVTENDLKKVYKFPIYPSILKYLRTKHIRSFIGEDIDMKNPVKIKNLLCLLSLQEAAAKSYVD